MKRPAFSNPTLALILALTLSATLAAQAPDIRSPDINTSAPDGAMLAEAGIAETAEERIPILESVLVEHPDTKYKGYVLLQLQGAYIQQQQWDKAVETGNALLEIVPNDLEVRHNINQSLLQLGRWDELGETLTAARPLADEAVKAPKPEDPDEDEEAMYESQIAYAEGVVQWLEWATNTAGLQQTDPAKKIAWMDRLRENYPESQYAKNREMDYVQAYQAAGDQANMVVWMKKAVEAGQGDEALLYQLAENAYGPETYEESKGYAQQILDRLEAQGDAPREGMTAEQWTAHKTKYEAYARFVLGRIEVAKNNKPGYRAGRAQLLQTVDFLKEEGGPRYHLLSYFLGVCYVQLDIQGDNIQKALYWMGQAASTDGPFKAQAQGAVKKIRAQ